MDSNWKITNAGKSISYEEALDNISCQQVRPHILRRIISFFCLGQGPPSRFISVGTSIFYPQIITIVTNKIWFASASDICYGQALIGFYPASRVIMVTYLIPKNFNIVFAIALFNAHTFLVLDSRSKLIYYVTASENGITNITPVPTNCQITKTPVSFYIEDLYIYVKLQDGSIVCYM